MLRRILKLLILFPLAVLLIFFAVYNHEVVEVKLFPFFLDEQLYSLSLPFYLYMYSTIVIGIIIGGFAMWLRQSRYRTKARLGAKDAKYWREKAECLARDRDANVP